MQKKISEILVIFLSSYQGNIWSHLLRIDLIFICFGFESIIKSSGPTTNLAGGEGSGVEGRPSTNTVRLLVPK